MSIVTKCDVTNTNLCNLLDNGLEALSSLIFNISSFVSVRFAPVENVSLMYLGERNREISNKIKAKEH